MELTGERLIPAPLAVTWEALNNPEALKACIAGCESLERTEPDTLAAVVAVKVGPVGARFKGTLKMHDVQAPHSYAIVFDGQGGVAGFGKGSADVTLSEEGSATRLRYAARAQVGGRMAQVGSRLIDAAASKIAEDFFAAFETRLQPAAVASVPRKAAPVMRVPPARIARWVLATVVLIVLGAWVWPSFAADNALGRAKQSVPIATASVPIQVAHMTLRIAAGYDEFTKSLEGPLGRFDASVMAMAAADPRGAEARIRTMEGEQGLMLFGLQNHGALLALAGRAQKAKRYQIGNPLIALEMTRHDLRAGLYAPLSVLVYQVDDHHVHVDFDQPSSLFGQFENPAIAEIARGLDDKMHRLIEKAAVLSRR